MNTNALANITKILKIGRKDPYSEKILVSPQNPYKNYQ